MIPYRVRQVIERHRYRPDDAALAWVRARLTTEEYALFCTQERGDQGHAVRVAQALAAQGHDDARLLAAALLHDVGKAPGIPLGYRTVAVLVKAVGGGRWLQRLSPQRRGVLTPLARSVHHPAIGAAAARRAGSDELTVTLIEHHQDKAAPLGGEVAVMLRALQAVDDAM